MTVRLRSNSNNAIWWKSHCLNNSHARAIINKLILIPRFWNIWEGQMTPNRDRRINADREY